MEDDVQLATTTTVQGRRRRRTAVIAVAAMLSTSVVTAVAASSATADGHATKVKKGTAAPHKPAYLDARRPVGERVRDLMSRMTLEEKIGQMTQAERGAVADDPSKITTWQLGSLLSGGGSTPAQNTPKAWADMIDQFQAAALQTRLKIPLLYGIDSVHGHGNLYGATIFPHNIGLGATRDPALVRKMEHIVAEETRASGPQWVFAPCICAAQDDRWGRTYESFSENPKLVQKFETAIDGFQGTRTSDLSHPDRVLATAKHFAGDGDTTYGTGSGDYKIDQGVTITSRRDFWRTDLRQYATAVRKHHVGSVMPSYSSVDFTDDGVGNPIKMHAERELITNVLKGKMGFNGFVISDYNGIHAIPDPSDPTNQDLTPYKVRTGVNAGTDMFMEPWTAPQFESMLRDQVDSGGVTMARINDAVRRILTKKFELGLFEHPYVDRRNMDKIGSAKHRAVARRAVAESQVLLKNSDHALPISKNASVYVAGSNADDMGNQAGGWTLSWQGQSGKDVIPGTTILAGIEAAANGAVTYSEDASAPVGDADVGVVVVGEKPYAEGFGDVGGPQWSDNGVPRAAQTMTLSDTDKTAIDKVCAAVATCVVSVVSGRPLVIDPAQLSHIDALVASWLPGSEGAGVSDTLFGKRPFTGKLSFTWPRSVAQEPINLGDSSYDPLFPYGYGLRTHRS
jgi:beta-glucosidase